jgi:hypothetical protein
MTRKSYPKLILLQDCADVSIYCAAVEFDPATTNELHAVFCEAKTFARRCGLSVEEVAVHSPVEWFDVYPDSQSDAASHCLVTPAKLKKLLGGAEPVRTTLDRLILSECGVFWRCEPKHEDRLIETGLLTWGDLDALGAEQKGK